MDIILCISYASACVSRTLTMQQIPTKKHNSYATNFYYQNNIDNVIAKHYAKQGCSQKL